jgi:ATP-dependent DNA helicase RecG
MARKRFNSSRRHAPQTERSYHEYLLSVPAPMTSRGELVRLLRGGEDTYLELKVKFSNVEKLTAEIIALANTDGGAMIFGVNDQLRIEGVDDPEDVEAQLREVCLRQIQPPVFPYINKVAFDNGRRIVVLEVDARNRPHSTLAHEFFLREGSTKRETTREELSAIYGEAPRMRFEQVPVFGARVADVDESLFWSYVRGVNPADWGAQGKGFPTERVLGELGLTANYKNEVLPTVGALLLFGLHERVVELLPHAQITLTRYGGTTAQAPAVEQQQLQGNLLRLFEGALAFVRRYADLWDAKPSRRALGEAQAEGGATPEQADEHALLSRANYHRGATVEALTNLLAHRDWGTRERRARLNVYDDAIEFINPAQLPALPISSLRYGIAQPPNPRLKAVFTNRHYGTTPAHGGVPMIFEEATNFARRAPEGLAILNHEFRLKLYGLR